MNVPAVNLRPMLAETETQWKANLERLFATMQFVLGEQVRAFEAEFAAASGARFAVATGSGTAALELCLREAEVPRGTEVITTALTSLFTAQAIRSAGAKPRFADVNPETLLIDPEDVSARISRRTAALLPVHLYGQACDLKTLGALARRTGIPLIQDACQAHGLRIGNKPLTAWSAWVAYSFYPTKNLPCLGDGGAVLTNRARAAERLRVLRDGGRRGDQIARLCAINSRLDEMQTCYLRAFLPRLGEWQAKRLHAASLYDEALAGCGAIRPIRTGADSVRHLYVVRAKRRNDLRAHLRRHGIAVAVHYPAPLHLQPAFADCGLRRGDLPQAEKACREILSLPVWPHISEAAVLHVAEHVRAFYTRAPRRRRIESV